MAHKPYPTLWMADALVPRSIRMVLPTPSSVARVNPSVPVLVWTIGITPAAKQLANPVCLGVSPSPVPP